MFNVRHVTIKPSTEIDFVNAKTFDVFISHSSKDSHAATAIKHYLESAAIRCWKAPDDIMPGESWPQAIARALNDSKTMVLIWSSHSTQSPEVSKELTLAMKNGVTVVPFRIEDVEAVGEWEYHLANTHWMDAFSGNIEEHFGGLVSYLNRILPGRNVTNSPVPAPELGLPLLAAPPLPLASPAPAMAINWIPTMILYCAVTVVSVLINLVGLVDPDVSGVLALLGLPLFIVALVFVSLLHHRCWESLPSRFRVTTPSKAVGYLFIPLFNLYWAFISWPKLADGLLAWQKTQRTSVLTDARGLALSYAILFVCSMTLGLIPGVASLISIGEVVVLFVMYGKIVPAINDMSSAR